MTGDISFWASGFSHGTCGNRNAGGDLGKVEIVQAATDMVLATDSTFCDDCWQQVTIDMSAYIGQGVYIRVVENMSGGGCAWLNVDEFTMAGGSFVLGNNVAYRNNFCCFFLLG